MGSWAAIPGAAPPTRSLEIPIVSWWTQFDFPGTVSSTGFRSELGHPFEGDAYSPSPKDDSGKVE